MHQMLLYCNTEPNTWVKPCNLTGCNIRNVGQVFGSVKVSTIANDRSLGMDVWNQWTGLPDWNTELEYWNGLNCCKKPFCDMTAF